MWKIHTAMLTGLTDVTLLCFMPNKLIKCHSWFLRRICSLMSSECQTTSDLKRAHTDTSIPLQGQQEDTLTRNSVQGPSLRVKGHVSQTHSQTVQFWGNSSHAMRTHPSCATHLSDITLRWGLIAGGQRLATGTLQSLQRESKVKTDPLARQLIRIRLYWREKATCCIA